MPALTRRHLLAGAAATAAVAAVPAAAIGAVATAPDILLPRGSVLVVGTGTPIAAGIEGDFFLDYVAGRLWAKTAEAWELRRDGDSRLDIIDGDWFVSTRRRQELPHED
jgi:hypothetical protein